MKYSDCHSIFIFANNFGNGNIYRSVINTSKAIIPCKQRWFQTLPYQQRYRTHKLTIMNNVYIKWCQEIFATLYSIQKCKMPSPCVILDMLYGIVVDLMKSKRVCVIDNIYIYMYIYGSVQANGVPVVWHFMWNSNYQNSNFLCFITKDNNTRKHVNHSKDKYITRTWYYSNMTALCFIHAWWHVTVDGNLNLNTFTWVTFIVFEMANHQH